MPLSRFGDGCGSVWLFEGVGGDLLKIFLVCVAIIVIIVVAVVVVVVVVAIKVVIAFILFGKYRINPH